MNAIITKLTSGELFIIVLAVIVMAATVLCSFAAAIRRHPGNDAAERAEVKEHLRKNRQEKDHEDRS